MDYSLVKTHLKQVIEVEASHTYLAAWSKPVDESQEGQSNGNSKDHKKLDCHCLLPQTGKILIPYGEKLLLAVRMSYKLAKK